MLCHEAPQPNRVGLSRIYINEYTNYIIDGNIHKKQYSYTAFHGDESFPESCLLFLESTDLSWQVLNLVSMPLGHVGICRINKEKNEKWRICTKHNINFMQLVEILIHYLFAVLPGSDTARLEASSCACNCNDKTKTTEKKLKSRIIS